MLLASHLVNDPAAGEAFAATAAAHLRPGGLAIGQTYPPGWDAAAGVGQLTRLGDATVEHLAADMAGDRLRSVVRYGVDGVTWEQPFEARILDEAGLSALLDAAGLAFDGWLGTPGWFRVRRA